MKIHYLFATLVLCTGMLFAQATQTQKPATPSPGATTHHHHGQNMAQHEQMMQQHIQQAQAGVDKLKADLAKVSDAATKQALQDDADMWQMMIDHMKSMGDMHKGMMENKGMQGGKGCAMGGSQTPPPENPK